jgi:hypothetical protein
VGRDGHASDGTAKTPDYDGGPKDPDSVDRGNGEIRYADGSTTTISSWNDASSRGYVETDKDASGRRTGGGGVSISADGTRTTSAFVDNQETGTTEHSQYIVTPDGNGHQYNWRTRIGSTPSETPYSGRGGFDEAWMDKSLPWFMDAVYVEWKRKNDLRKSGGMISQPGRGEDPSPGASEGPRVGASAVTNCGDTGTNPCAHFESVEVRPQGGGWGSISQPMPDIPTGGPVPMPIPGPNPQLKP